MHTTSLERWKHEHAYDDARAVDGERRVKLVALLTAGFMVVEVVAGWLSGSMALLADGLHMASHAVALGIAAAAYAYARRHARDERFSFGTGKVNSLAGFTGALLLALFALGMAGESVRRLLEPVAIAFDQAIAVAVVGLAVNGVSVLLLGARHDGHDDHDHDHDEHESRDHHHHDHNRRSAYLHVLADALTSVFAIVALLGAKLAGWTWLDPAMGVVGAVLVGRWSAGLLRDSARVLLDHQAPPALRDRIRSALETDSDARVADLHVWSIGPGVHAACVSLVVHEPKPPEHYRRLLPADARVHHATIEVHACQ